MKQMNLFYLGILYDDCPSDFYFLGSQDKADFVWYHDKISKHTLSDKTLDKLEKDTIDFYVGEVYCG